MTLYSTIERGAPPIGLGLFLRADYVDGPWSWVAVQGAASNYAHVAAQAKAAGKRVWIYAMPASFTPQAWRDGLAMLLVRGAEIGADGIIVDPENGWSASDNQALSAFGAALQDAATQTRVGITSFPSWGPLAGLAQAAGDACFGIPQIYGQQGAFTQSEIDAQWSRWRTSFGTRLIPAFAMWVPADHEEMADPATYNAYLTRLPAAGGAIGWMSGPIPVHMLAAVRDHFGGLGAMLTFGALGAISWVGRPAGAVTVGLAISLLVMLILLYRTVRHA